MGGYKLGGGWGRIGWGVYGVEGGGGIGICFNYF